MYIEKVNPSTCNAGVNKSSVELGEARQHINKTSGPSYQGRKRRRFRVLPTVKRIGEVFRFEPCGGRLIAAISRGGLAKGSVCGTRHQSGHIQCFVDGVAYRASRLIYKAHYGADPKGIILHRNGDLADNRISNLKEVV